MANSKRYIIPGVPVALSRARVNFNTRKIYDDQVRLKNGVRLLLLRQHGREPLFKGALKVDFSFCFKKEGAGFYHTYVPDLSNLIKMVEDIATDILYENDCLIAEITAVKCYSASAYTEFTITELSGENG